MKHLKNLCNSSISNEELHIEAEERMALESEYLLMQYILAKDIADHGLSLLGGIKEIDIENYLSVVLSTHVTGPISLFNPLEARFIVRSRILTWMAGGSGVSIETLDLLLEHKRYMNFVPAISKHYDYKKGDVKPAAELLDYLLDFADVRETFAATDIIPFTSGNFVQIGFAASLMERIDKVWSLFMYSTFVSSVIFNSNNRNYHLKPGTYSDGMGDILEKLLSINPDNKMNDDIPVIQSIPMQMQSYLSNAQCYAEAIEQSIIAPVDNLGFSGSEDEALSQPAAYNLDMAECILDLIDSIKVMSGSIIQRTEHMLSGKLAELLPSSSLIDDKSELAPISKIMLDMKEQVTASLKIASIEERWQESSSDVMACASLLEQRLDEIINLIKIELFAQSRIYENTPSVADRINLLHEREVPFNTLIFARYKLDGDKDFNEFMDFVEQEYDAMWNNELYAEYSLRSIYIGE